MYENIKKIIKTKSPNIDNETLKYYTNYFVVLSSKNVIPEDMTITELIENVLNFKKIVFFDDDDPIAKKYGNDFNGVKEICDETLYIRKSLPDKLKEIVVYHEIHHAAQTKKENSINENQKIKQKGFGNLIWEAQTQWFAEQVYKTIHNVSFEEKKIPSKDLRMAEGSTITSDLHNYEMYDAMLSKLSIIIGEPKDFFVKINFMYNENKGMNLLKEKWDYISKQTKLPYTFKDMMVVFDYVYTVDYISYAENEDKELLLNGYETKNIYIIHSDFKARLSQKEQKISIDKFDLEMFFNLDENGGDTQNFSKYIFNNHYRKVIKERMPNINSSKVNDSDSIKRKI